MSFLKIFRTDMIKQFYGLRLLCTSNKLFSSQPPPQLTEGEKKIVDILNEKFPQATDVQASDISGGCGSMYEIYIEAPDFQGKRTVMQHRMVNEALKEEIKDMHGLRITTSPPTNS